MHTVRSLLFGHENMDERGNQKLKRSIRVVQVSFCFGGRASQIGFSSGAL